MEDYTVPPINKWAWAASSLFQGWWFQTNTIISLFMNLLCSVPHGSFSRAGPVLVHSRILFLAQKHTGLTKLLKKNK